MFKKKSLMPVQPKEVIESPEVPYSQSEHIQQGIPLQQPGQPVIHHFTQVHNNNLLPEKPGMTIPQKVEHVFIFLYTTLAIFLGTRFVFSIININLDAPIVALVYQVTQPFMSPFQGMFSRCSLSEHSILSMKL